MPRLIIVSHHPVTSRGSLMSPLHVGWITPREDVRAQAGRWTVDYLFTGDRGMISQFQRLAADRETPAILLFAELNSMASWRALAVLALNAVGLKAPQVIYWHGASMNIRRFAGLEEGSAFSRCRRRLVNAVVRHFTTNSRTYHWAASRIVKQAIMMFSGAVPERITVVNEALDLPSYHPVERSNRPSRQPFKVCGVGDPTYRKGVDWFVQVASLFERQAPGAYAFTWYGVAREDLARWNMQWTGRDCLGSPVVWGGWTDQLGQMLRQQDAYFLSSREDPFPLAALEALACDLPVFTFDSSGTAEILPAEFVARDVEEVMAGIRAYRERMADYPPGFFRSLAQPHDALPFRQFTERRLEQILAVHSSRYPASVRL